jgi:hypothetical protein
MGMPFTTQEFFQLFGAYNTAIWPAQIALVALAVMIVLLAFIGRGNERTPALSLAALWMWTGVVYHIVFFRRINPVAAGFGVLFVIQATLLTVAGARRALTFHFDRTAKSWLGLAFIVYAVIVYPQLAATLGHNAPNAPSFGAPCPLTIFTLGVLLWASGPVWPLAVIPLVWSVVGTSAAFTLDMAPDLGLGISAVLFLVAIIAGRLSHGVRRTA